MTACIILLWDGRLDAFESLEGIFNMAIPGLGQEDLTWANVPHSLNVTLGLFLHVDSTCAHQPGVQRFSFFLLSAQAKALTPRLTLLAPSTLMYFPKYTGNDRYGRITTFVIAWYSWKPESQGQLSMCILVRRVQCWRTKCVIRESRLLSYPSSSSFFAPFPNLALFCLSHSFCRWRNSAFFT